jgi:hypothetical protein
VTTAHVLLVRPAGSVERVVFVPAAAALPADQVPWLDQAFKAHATTIADKKKKTKFKTPSRV